MLNLQTLVLNADFRPLSYNPLSLWSWRDALTALMLDRVQLVANYDVEARSPRISYPVPSVVALKRYKKLDGFPAFTRYNIYLRDLFTCQYCAEKFPTEDLTFDHVIPRSRNGRTSWENVVAACAPCNSRKANKTPTEAGMALLKPARRPTRTELARRLPRTLYKDVHETWVDYLYWDSPLDDE
jgi:5-methylcytosine-specific restriction endonuclease McrA